MTEKNTDTAGSLAPSGVPANVPCGVHRFAWGGLLLLVLLVAGLSQIYRGKNIWSGWAESRELRHHAYAERIYVEDLLRTRANSWSNLAYVVVGLYALALGWQDRRLGPAPNGGYLVRTPGMSLLFGACCCYLGLGSGFYHASLTRVGQQVDVAAMFMPLLVLCAINLGRWVPRLKLSRSGQGICTWPFLTALSLVSAILLFRYKWSIRTGVVMNTLILTLTAFALLDLVQRRWKLPAPLILISGAALVSARLCWQWDIDGKFSGPDTWFQGHSVWHLLTALSLAGMYFYYRLEVSHPAPESARV